MTRWSVTPGPPAGPADLLRAQDRERLLRTQLERIRANAKAWRSGLGAVLVALAGFSLIRGRSDLTQLARPWPAVVGAVLGVAFAAGAVAALSLLRAAYGRPWMSEMKDVLPGVLGDHQETVAAARALVLGVALALTCAVLLLVAVGLTWYGPARDEPELRVVTPHGTYCGTVVQVASGTLTLKTADGEVGVDLRTATGMQPGAACP